MRLNKDDVVVECEGVTFECLLPCLREEKESRIYFSWFRKVCMKFWKDCMEFWLNNQSEVFLENSTLSLFDEELPSL